MPFHKKPKFPRVYADYYEKLQPYDGREAWLKRYLEQPENGRNLFCVHWTCIEVHNGGLWQFFYNSTGNFAPEAVKGFDAIGMHDVANILREAISRFPDEYPFNREIRQELVGHPGGEKAKVEFDNLDDKFYDLTLPPRTFFSVYKYHTFADAYAKATGGLNGI
jgi:Domain of unknown function (DUF4375)